MAATELAQFEMVPIGACEEFSADDEAVAKSGTTRFERAEMARSRYAHAATACYFAIGFGHAALLGLHATGSTLGDVGGISRTGSDASGDAITTTTVAVLSWPPWTASSIWRLCLLQACLCIEAFIYGVGDPFFWWGHEVGTCRHWAASRGLALLEHASRWHLLFSVVAWSQSLPWVAELGCRCGATPTGRGGFLCCHALIREFGFILCGEPASALDPSVRPKFGDCLPSQAMLGGQYRLAGVDLVGSGRAVFVPARPRSGVQIAAGLVFFSHLILGLTMAFSLRPPPLPTSEPLSDPVTEGNSSTLLLYGVICSFVCRKAGGITESGYRGKRPEVGEEDAPTSSRWLSSDVFRLVGMVGDLAWMWCCVQEFHFRASGQFGQWIPQCVDIS
eukprot:TRINITY_DN36311_c0_g1_i1.p1 TRINITY_DN36311_c0_g1~~TRINITY_DN36311_c0_g1_i1.p1  ORF type:complete len:391 (+),score=45.15 TRINITY_DN36311_c0_g1_i1:150-1322(+)